MNPILEQLLRLQRLDSDIRDLGHELQQIPKKSKLIDEEVISVKEPLDKALEEKASLETEHLNLEEKCKSLEEKERMLKLKMPEIRSNDEYGALIREMDSTKREHDKAFDLALKTEERLGAIGDEILPLEEAYTKGEESVADKRAALQREQEGLSDRLLEKKKERESLQKEMSAVWFRKYTHIAAHRNGLAVAAVKSGTCQGCFMGVRPKLVQDLHYGEEVVSCEGCQRVLYLETGPRAN